MLAPAGQPRPARAARVHARGREGAEGDRVDVPESGYDLGEVLTQAGTGEAVVTVLSERGAPTPVAWTRLRAPVSLMAPTDAAAVTAAVAASPLQAKYGTALDRSRPTRSSRRRSPPRRRQRGRLRWPRLPRRRRARRQKPEPSTAEKVMRNPAVKAVAVAAATTIGREIVRGLFGARKKK